MEAEELMLGDLVTFADCEEIVPVKVVALGLASDSIGGIIGDDKAADEIGIDDLAGIPLTAEILEKNGFVCNPNKDEDDDWWALIRLGVPSGNEYVNIAFRGNDVAIYDLDIMKGSNAGNFHLNYIHELQHALRLCGIDKTFEL